MNLYLFLYGTRPSFFFLRINRVHKLKFITTLRFLHTSQSGYYLLEERNVQLLGNTKGFRSLFLPGIIVICFAELHQVILIFILNRVAIGYDEGTIMIKIGREVPVASMDSSGKVIWAKHNEIQTVNIRSVGADFEVYILPAPISFFIPPQKNHLSYVAVC